MKVNKKFRNIIKYLNIFCDFIEERKNSWKIETTSEIFRYDSCYYLTLLINKLREKYTSSIVDDFFTENLKFLINRLTNMGISQLECYEFWSNIEFIKYLSEALKVNKTLTRINLNLNEFINNSDGVNSEYIKFLSEAII